MDCYVLSVVARELWITHSLDKRQETICAISGFNVESFIGACVQLNSLSDIFERMEYKGLVQFICEHVASMCVMNREERSETIEN